jgi:dihydropteroate synthase
LTETKSRLLRTRAGDLDLSQKTRLMGILNATPDSFSDGGPFLTPEAAISRAEEMIEEGADIIDVGGESTRPGALPVSAEEELARVARIVELLAQRYPRTPISVDTMKAQVARQCLDAGASIINDVSALEFDSHMAAVVTQHGVPVVLMHMQGMPGTMQKNPVYDNVVQDVAAFLTERAAFAQKAGIARENIVIDPGIGFGKTTAHNLAILNNLPAFTQLGFPVLIGLSRKGFLGKILGGETTPVPVGKRGEASLAANLWAAARGAQILRVHDVGATRRALDAWASIVGDQAN